MRPLPDPASERTDQKPAHAPRGGRRPSGAAGHRGLLAAAGLVLALLALVGPAAGRADAHAVLLSTTPADRAALDRAPAEITLEFNEHVTATLGGVRAYDGEGHRVDDGDPRVDGTRIRLGLRDGLGDGAYVVTFRAISADSHPVSGAFAFTVGDATAASDDTIADLLGEGDDRTWEILGAIARGLAYAGALTAAGLGAFLVLAFDGGDELATLRRWSLRGAIAGAVGVLAALPFQAARATGLGLGALFEKGVASRVLGDGVGWSSAVVLAGLVALAVDEGRHRALTVAAATAATAGFAIAGHTTTADPRWPVTIADAAHAAAGAVWLGSLVGLVVVLRNRRGERAATAALVVGRFSTMAAVALLVVAAGGLLVGWREVRALHALGSTTYGKLLIAKVAVVAGVAFIGAWNRFRLVPAIARAPKRAGSMLAKTVRIEGAALLVAVAVTAVLVNVTPARTAAGIGTIFSDTVPFGDGSVNVVVDPNRAGPNAIHLYVFDDAGRVTRQQFDDLKVELSLPSAEIGPLEREPYVAGPGHFQVDGSDLSIAGDWTIDIVARDQFDEVTAEVTVPVNP